jgi:hypothetical protein
MWKGAREDSEEEKNMVDEMGDLRHVGKTQMRWLGKVDIS